MDGNDKYMFAGDFEHRLKVISVINLNQIASNVCMFPSFRFRQDIKILTT